MSNVKQSAETVLELSKALLDLAKSGAWTDMAEMEQRRTAVLEQLFRLPAQGPEDWHILRQTAEAVRAMDGETLRLAERERDQAAGQLRKLQLGRQGNKAYMAVKES